MGLAAGQARGRYMAERIGGLNGLTIRRDEDDS
jgi:hypothetical protein